MRLAKGNICFRMKIKNSAVANNGKNLFCLTIIVQQGCI